jgi:hypothetical protein
VRTEIITTCQQFGLLDKGNNMNTDYVVSLTPVEVKALEYVSTNCNEWIQNAIHERCRLAMEQLVGDEIAAKLSAGGSVSGTKEEIVMASTLPNALARHEEMYQQMLNSAPPSGA